VTHCIGINTKSLITWLYSTAVTTLELSNMHESRLLSASSSLSPVAASAPVTQDRVCCFFVITRGCQRICHPGPCVLLLDFIAFLTLVPYPSSQRSSIWRLNLLLVHRSILLVFPSSFTRSPCPKMSGDDSYHLPVDLGDFIDFSDLFSEPAPLPAHGPELVDEDIWAEFARVAKDSLTACFSRLSTLQPLRLSGDNMPPIETSPLRMAYCSPHPTVAGISRLEIFYLSFKEDIVKTLIIQSSRAALAVFLASGIFPGHHHTVLNLAWTTISHALDEESFDIPPAVADEILPNVGCSVFFFVLSCHVLIMFLVH
jgi:hypothetical protein